MQNNYMYPRHMLHGSPLIREATGPILTITWSRKKNTETQNIVSKKNLSKMILGPTWSQ